MALDLRTPVVGRATDASTRSVADGRRLGGGARVYTTFKRKCREDQGREDRQIGPPRTSNSWSLQAWLGRVIIEHLML